MTDARILSTSDIDFLRGVLTRRDLDKYDMAPIFASHEALRAKLAEVEADRTDILARRDRVLDDLRQSWEAEIAARKLVEAKLTVAEDARKRVHEAWSRRTEEGKCACPYCSQPKTPANDEIFEHAADLELKNDRLEQRAETAEAALAERTKERDEAQREVQTLKTFIDIEGQVARAEQAEAALARVREALEGVLANHCLDCGAHYCRYCSARSPEWAHTEHCYYVRSVQAFEKARAALTPAAPEPPKGDPR
jgi:hypothetical protein